MGRGFGDGFRITPESDEFTFVFPWTVADARWDAHDAIRVALLRQSYSPSSWLVG
jgi:hypothetical protein